MGVDVLLIGVFIGYGYLCMVEELLWWFCVVVIVNCLCFYLMGLLRFEDGIVVIER